MKKEKVSVLANVLIALSTFFGVGGAVAYYMKETLEKAVGYIILTEIIYVLAIVMILIVIGVKLE